MEKFLEDITTGYWWLGVVIVGIFINVASAYVRSGLENQLGKFSKYWAAKKDSRLKRREKLLSLLKENKMALFLYAKSETRFRIYALVKMIVSVGFMVIYLVILTLLQYKIDLTGAQTEVSVLTVSQQIGLYVSLLPLLLGLGAMLSAILDAYSAIKIKTNINEAFSEIVEAFPESDHEW